MRIECFKNKRISKLLKTKDKYIQAGRVLSKKQEEIEQELKKLALQVQKIKDVVTPLVNEKIKELNLSELDEVAKVSLLFSILTLFILCCSFFIVATLSQVRT